MNFKDHFSGHAATYSVARPSYLNELFAYLASLYEAHLLVCGRGTRRAVIWPLL